MVEMVWMRKCEECGTCEKNVIPSLFSYTLFKKSFQCLNCEKILKMFRRVKKNIHGSFLIKSVITTKIYIMECFWIFITASILWESFKYKVSDSCDLWLLSYRLPKFRHWGNFWPDFACFNWQELFLN